MGNSEVKICEQTEEQPFTLSLQRVVAFGSTEMLKP